MSSLYTLYHLLRWTFSMKTIWQISETFLMMKLRSQETRITLSEIIFPIKIDQLLNGDLFAFSLRGYEESQNRTTASKFISRTYNGGKLVFVAGTYDIVAQLLRTMTRTVGLSNFFLREIKSSEKYEVIFGKYEGITFQVNKNLV